MEDVFEGLTYVNEESGQFQIALTPQANAWDIFKYYFHEAGHVLASFYSFKEILRPFEELRSYNPLTTNDRKVMMSLFNRDDRKKIPMEGRQKKVADNVLAYISQGVWDGSIFVHSATPQEITNILGESRETATYTVQQVEGKLTVALKYTKEGVTDEIPAYFIEQLSLMSLTNALGLPYQPLTIPQRRNGDSHDGAIRIASYFLRKGVIVESYVDRQQRIRD